MIYAGLDFDFTVKQYTYEYHAMTDVIAKIGGISSTIKLIMISLTPIMAFKFMFIFANILKRKSNQKVRIFRIKDIKKARKIIKKRIQEKMENNPNDLDI